MKESKLLKDYPKALSEWDYELNARVLAPELLPAHTDTKYYWKCSNGSDTFNTVRNCNIC